MTAKTRTADKAVRSELRRIKAAHPDLLQHADALAAMHRLSRLRCRFHELSRLIEANGGADGENLAMVAECRQLSRAAGVIERDLRNWFQVHAATSGAFELLSLARNAILARGQLAPPIEAMPEQRSFSARALLRRDRDDMDA